MMIKDLLRITFICLLLAMNIVSLPALADDIHITTDATVLKFKATDDPYNVQPKQETHSFNVHSNNTVLGKWNIELANTAAWTFINIDPTTSPNADQKVEVTFNKEKYSFLGDFSTPINIYYSYWDVAKQETVNKLEAQVEIQIAYHKETVLTPDRGVQGEIAYVSVPMNGGDGTDTKEDFQLFFDYVKNYLVSTNPGVHIEDVNFDEANSRAIIKLKIDRGAKIGPSNFIMHLDQDTGIISEEDEIIYFWVISKFTPATAKQGQTLDVKFDHYNKLVLDNNVTAEWLKNTLIFNVPGITVNSAKIASSDNSTLVTYNLTIDQDTKTGKILASTPLAGKNIFVPFTILAKDPAPPVTPEVIVINPTKEVIIIYPTPEVIVVVTTPEVITIIITPETIVPTPETLVEILIDSIYPASAPSGTECMIQGSEFGQSQGASFVKFEDQQTHVTYQAKALSWGDKTIKAIVPYTGNKGNYKVTVMKVSGLAGKAKTQESSPAGFNISSLGAGAGQALIYPNPYNPILDAPVKIAYDTNNASSIGAYIYDVTGRLTYMTATSSNEITWDGHDKETNLVSNGAYLVRIINESNKQLLAKGKVLVIK